MVGVPSVVTRTGGVLRRALGRRDARALFALTAVGYPLLYLWTLGHLSVSPLTDGVDLLVVSDPLVRMFATRSPFNYEPIARLVVPPVVLLVSPLNLLLAVALGALVGANAAVGLVSWRAPAACGTSARAGPMAGLFGLFSGATCCGPAILFVVGLQVTGTVVSLFGALVPVAILALVGTLLLAGRGATAGTGAETSTAGT